ncbi:serine hydrolase [Tenacibaculum sp. SDUM215027]|uniref:serine hydrolase domain-containing protein n=1 Tax=Tenacibaculum sp. SDUM215027 TaxID=3422596 RepID=UPI003D31C8C1
MKYTNLTLVLLIIICGCKSSGKIAEKQNDKQDWVNYLFRNYIGEKPSASFIVIKEGKTLDCQSFGYADLENKVLANSQTNYRLGSVTKQFTAMGVLILINQGQLNYDTKLNEVITEFPDYGKEITIKDLLTHRSGLQPYNKLYPKDAEKQIVDKDVLNLLIAQDSLLFPANSKYKYSNSGYAILAIIIERISGRTFKDFMDKEIFNKIGMTNSTVYLNDLNIKNRAQGYKLNDTLYENNDQNTWSAIQGDGGIYSSVSDYLNWDRSLYDETLIKTELRNDAFSNWDKNGKNDQAGYGFGWHIKIKNNIKYLIHGGLTTGFRNFSLRIPSEKITIVIYTNISDYSYKDISNKGFALASLYSDNKLPMPIDLAIEREISNNGSENISKYYNELTTNKNKYEINPKDLTSLGFVYKRKKEDESCLNIFNLVIEKFPDYFGGYYGLAQYYKAEENNQKAIQYYKIVTELGTSNDQFQINYSKKMIKQLSE